MRGPVHAPDWLIARTERGGGLCELLRWRTPDLEQWARERGRQGETPGVLVEERGLGAHVKVRQVDMFAVRRRHGVERGGETGRVLDQGHEMAERRALHEVPVPVVVLGMRV